MYPACLIGTRAVALMGVRTHFGLISGQVGQWCWGDHLGQQTLGAYLNPFHAAISVASGIRGRLVQMAATSFRLASKALPLARTLQAIRASLFARAVASLFR